jgi:hypothetical protein
MTWNHETIWRIIWIFRVWFEIWVLFNFIKSCMFVMNHGQTQFHATWCVCIHNLGLRLGITHGELVEGVITCVGPPFPYTPGRTRRLDDLAKTTQTRLRHCYREISPSWCITKWSNTNAQQIKMGLSLFVVIRCESQFITAQIESRTRWVGNVERVLESDKCM